MSDYNRSDLHFGNEARFLVETLVNASIRQAEALERMAKAMEKIARILDDVHEPSEPQDHPSALRVTNIPIYG